MSLLVVNLDENLLKEFRSYAAAKHGRLRNALRPEVEAALRKYLDRQKAKAFRKAAKSAMGSPHVVSDKQGSDSR